MAAAVNCFEIDPIGKIDRESGGPEPGLTDP
jgi:hypothetical protein